MTDDFDYVHVGDGYVLNRNTIYALNDRGWRVVKTEPFGDNACINAWAITDELKGDDE